MTGDDDARRVLGVSADTDRAEVRAAFRRKIRAAHPDHSGDQSEDNLDAVRDLLEAYRTLGESDSGPHLGPSARFAFDGPHARQDPAPSTRHLQMIMVSIILLVASLLVLLFLIGFSQSGR